MFTTVVQNWQKQQSFHQFDRKVAQKTQNHHKLKRVKQKTYRKFFTLVVGLC